MSHELEVVEVLISFKIDPIWRLWCRIGF